MKGGSFAREDCEVEDFTKFYVDLEAEADGPLVVPEMEEDAADHRYILLNDLLFGKLRTLAQYPEEAQDIIQHHKESAELLPVCHDRDEGGSDRGCDGGLHPAERQRKAAVIVRDHGGKDL